VNAASFVAIIVALCAIRPDELRPGPVANGSIRFVDGLSYVRRTPSILIPLLIAAAVGTFAWEFQVSLPLLAKETFGRANLYGTMSTSMGLGGAIGALAVASRSSSRRPLAVAYSALVMGLFLIAVALAPSLGLALVGIMVMGAAGMAFVTICSASLQINVDPAMRGRVMGLWTLAIVGSSCIGGPMVGWFADQFGARYSLAIGGVVAMAAGLAAAPRLRRLTADRRKERHTANGRAQLR
jgi:MFS family permease